MITAGALGLLVLLLAAVLFWRSAKENPAYLVIEPNIAEFYRQELEAELAEKKERDSQEPNNVDTLLEIGILEQRLGRLSAAESAFKRALQINSRDYLIYMYLGILYDEMERFAEADNMLRIATQLDPRDERPFQALITLYKRHFPEKADELDNIFRAASDHTKNPAIWSEYAQFLEDRREYRQSWIYWQEVLKAQPENEQAAAKVKSLADQLKLAQ